MKLSLGLIALVFPVICNEILSFCVISVALVWPQFEPITMVRFNISYANKDDCFRYQLGACARARLCGPTAAKGSLYTSKDNFLFVSDYDQDYDHNQDGLKSSIKGDSSKKTKQQLYRFGYISWFKFMLSLQVIHNLKAIVWLNSPDQVRQWPARPDCPRSSGVFWCSSASPPGPT